MLLLIADAKDGGGFACLLKIMASQSSNEKESFGCV